jgi:glutathione S-transferase
MISFLSGKVTMKLYFSKGACSLSIRIVAHELGLKLDYEAVDLREKLTASGENYLEINPKGSVPALALENDSILTENIAILQYLADMHPSSLLPPVGDMQRYRVIEWLSFMASDLHKTYSPLINPKLPAEVKESILIPNLKNKLLILDLALSGKKYLMGEEFTLPDAYCFVVLRWMPRVGVELKAYPQLLEYFERIRHRAAVEAALREE